MEQFDPVCLSALTSHEHVKQIKHHLLLLSLAPLISHSLLSFMQGTDRPFNC